MFSEGARGGIKKVGLSLGAMELAGGNILSR